VQVALACNRGDQRDDLRRIFRLAGAEKVENLCEDGFSVLFMY
jgi:hypothetical protein